MAEIEIVYRVGYCGYNRPKYCEQCHTCCANDMGCEYAYIDGIVRTAKGIEIPSGVCNRAMFEYKRKGWVGKRYEIEEYEDPYNPWLNCMSVKLGNTYYNCVKVTLNGECIYNEYDDDKAF